MEYPASTSPGFLKRPVTTLARNVVRGLLKKPTWAEVFTTVRIARNESNYQSFSSEYNEISKCS